ncbi:ribosome maturation factor RimP [candidate division KSB1 bacterium]|nr:MAG: ribosome maturation factor RimP [candidate division KSB1 bacterium]MBC6948555.1 ribosome maturation factor RimP [candidate division KSB1 bacterium]MCE7942398.1 ribosome maturation factor RimP [Chlorobi bacterium CHB1]MDL1878100.1 ribosome maturation factor RimP [Cytophagia bacterium CHB2]NUM73749.1 ribosome maturation factor RimP [candidate division KSB1 bacterium]
MEHLRERLLPIITPIVTQQFGVDLIEVELKGSKANMVVRIIVDADGGVKLETCAAVNRAIGDALDTTDVMPGRYRLEVSSPGIDRPLRTPRDFQRNLGRAVHLRYHDKDETKETEGVIERVSDAGVSLETTPGTLTIPFPAIDYGKVIIKW